MYENTHFVERIAMQRIIDYCTSTWRPKNKEQEINFLKDSDVAYVTSKKITSTNPGILGEKATKWIIETEGFKWQTPGKINGMRPDGYVPELNLFLEVKTRSYHIGGSASEKLDSIPRKYSKLLQESNGAKCIVVFAANQMYEKNGKELSDAFAGVNKLHNAYVNPYTIEFVDLCKKYGIINMIPITHLRIVLHSLKSKI